MKVLLFDNTFSPSPSTVAGHTPKYWEYTTNPESDWQIALYTHEQIFSPKTPQEKSYGLLFESPAIRKDLYEGALKYLDVLRSKFTHIFTFHPDLLAADPRFFLFAPAYGYWVGMDFGGGRLGINPKTEDVSCIASDKGFCQGHYVRQHINKWLDANKLASCFGNSVGKPVNKVAEAIESFRFSVVVENCVCNNYFTEKLLNCFACGTIPIYVGCQNINVFFDVRGIIHIPSYTNCINNIANIIYMLKSNMQEEYEKKLPYAITNHQKVKQYSCIEDYVHEQYFLQKNF